MKNIIPSVAVALAIGIQMTPLVATEADSLDGVYRANTSVKLETARSAVTLDRGDYYQGASRPT